MFLVFLKSGFVCLFFVLYWKHWYQSFRFAVCDTFLVLDLPRKNWAKLLFSVSSLERGPRLCLIAYTESTFKKKIWKRSIWSCKKHRSRRFYFITGWVLLRLRFSRECLLYVGKAFFGYVSVLKGGVQVILNKHKAVHGGAFWWCSESDTYT